MPAADASPGTTAPFRLGLVGAGRMGRTHLRALAGADAVRVVAVAEPSTAARAAVAAAAAPADVYASVAEMLDAAACGRDGRTGLDGVLICAPTDRHLNVVTEVAAAGLPILCEKPCGLDSAQATAAAQAATAAGVPLQIAYWRRYVPQLRALREQVLNGELGDIHLVGCYQWDESPPAAAFRQSSGGIFVDMGVHEFDQMRWLTGQEFSELSVVSGPGEAPGDPDSAQAIARLSGGTVGLVSLGRYHPAGDMVRAEVFGTRDTVQCVVLDPREGERVQLAALAAQAADFAALVRGASATGGATAADAVAALRAAERAVAAMPAPTAAK
jgi:myo-inositol 2-dehydrogenase / D-chiro-inositol 1-dehydrogenase